jgi:hypothetical protein
MKIITQTGQGIALACFHFDAQPERLVCRWRCSAFAELRQ